MCVLGGGAVQVLEQLPVPRTPSWAELTNATRTVINQQQWDNKCATAPNPTPHPHYRESRGVITTRACTPEAFVTEKEADAGPAGTAGQL